jgi:hypothetical protein
VPTRLRSVAHAKTSHHGCPSGLAAAGPRAPMFSSTGPTPLRPDRQEGVERRFQSGRWRRACASQQRMRSGRIACTFSRFGSLFTPLGNETRYQRARGTGGISARCDRPDMTRAATSESMRITANAGQRRARRKIPAAAPACKSGKNYLVGLPRFASDARALIFSRALSSRVEICSFA